MPDFVSGMLGVMVHFAHHSHFDRTNLQKKKKKVTEQIEFEEPCHGPHMHGFANKLCAETVSNPKDDCGIRQHLLATDRSCKMCKCRCPYPFQCKLVGKVIAMMITMFFGMLYDRASVKDVKDAPSLTRDSTPLQHTKNITSFHSTRTSLESSLSSQRTTGLDSTENPVTIKLTRQHLEYSVDGHLHVRTAFSGWIAVGTPAQQFRLLIDTGSGNLIVPSTYCTSTTCRAHRRYSRKRSLSAVDINSDGTPAVPGEPRDRLDVTFGTGKVSGVLAEEKVCLSDEFSVSSLSNFSEPDQVQLGCMKMKVILATAMDDDLFRLLHCDGVLGLGLEGLSHDKEFNFLSRAASSLQQWSGTHISTFSIFLSDDDTESSSLTLGGYSSEKMHGSLVWNSVFQANLGHWMLEVQSLRVNGVALEFCDQGCRAIVDTGTSLLTVPSASFPEIFTGLKHPIPASGLCDGPGPMLEFVLENFTVVLGPEDLARVHADSSPPQWGVRPGAQAQNMAYCKPMLMVMDVPMPLGPKLFLLGEPVLRKFYTVFDTQEKRVGFAHARHIRGASSHRTDTEGWWYDV